ncbi:uncharacterized protein LOC144903705 [Branchiostoma floridae x Branchiostoma belcheri]
MGDHIRRHNEGVLSGCQEGDLLEFPRGAISHWGVYVGDGKVVHRTGDKANGGKKNGKAEIREDLFWDVVGDSLARINNYLDEMKVPLPGPEIVRRARGKLGDVGYNLLSKNCEHFVTWCRYGEGFSQQRKVSSSRTQMSDYVNRHNTGVLLLCEEGDLLEFPRGDFSHWVVHVGEGRVIHRTGDKANGGNGKAEIREDSFWDIVGDSLARINNYLDKERDPLPGPEIVRRAREKLGDVGYNLLSKNCEHFVTWCRYGVEISHQVGSSASDHDP